jgi:hypothetical protein
MIADSYFTASELDGYDIDGDDDGTVIAENDDYDEAFDIEYGEYLDKKIYHRAGMHTRLPLIDVIKSISKNGLTIGTATGGDGPVDLIWFSTDFSSYGDNGKFVVSIIMSKENIERYRLIPDGSVVFAKNDIPFESLKIEKCPIYALCLPRELYFFTNFSDTPRNIGHFENLVNMCKNNPNRNHIMYKDVWDYFNIPYDIEIIENIPNLKIENLIS